TLLGSIENENRIDFSIWALSQEIAEMFRRNLHEMYQQVTTAQEEKPLEDILIEYLKKALQGREATAREIQQSGPVEIRKLKAVGLLDLLRSIEKSGIIDHKRDGKKEVWFLVH
ncbi:MAG TPA: hypothetical protein VEP90_24905, partial [Methylomirabilota bacterium]|nr:hypothetical protein [Methylomirabilota bacterium]